jgi:hypothetical protein
MGKPRRGLESRRTVKVEQNPSEERPAVKMINLI